MFSTRSAPFVINQPMNAAILRIYLERCVVPTLKLGGILMIGNLPAHKRRCARHHRSGRRAIALSALLTHPISIRSNKAFAKIKSYLRKAEERSLPALWDRIATILDGLSAAACKNFFNHAGYA